MVKICFYYDRNNKYKDIVDELNITQNNETLQDLIIFLNNHNKQRINLCVSNPYDFLNSDIFNLKEYNNLFIRFNKEISEPVNKELQEKMKENNIPFYYTEIASDWDVFNGLIAQGVSDIYIGNSLGFELDKVAAAAHRHNIKIRAFPNVAQSTWDESDDITKFFIRPEDTIIYSQYIDCFEFYEIANVTNSEILYEIYKFDKKWDGDLQAIILFLNESINNYVFDDFWATHRIKCGKQCAKDGRCQICHKIIEMNEKMTDKEIMLNRFLTKKLY